MTDPGTHPLEAILRHIAQAAPQPWYPSNHAQAAGVSRESLDPYLDQLRLGGLVHLTDWVQGRGQGYALTPEGTAVLQNARQMAQLRQGSVPPHRPHDRPAGSDRKGEMSTWDRGETVREALHAPRQPFVTRLLLIINVAVFAAGFLLAWQDGVQNQFLAGGTQRAIRLTGGVNAPEILEGQWWRLFSHFFVHLGVLHLIVNMYALWVIGPISEDMWGHTRFLILYLLSGLGSICVALSYEPIGAGGYIAGASGALCGAMAAVAVWVVLNRNHLSRELVSSLLRNLMINFVLIAVISMIPGVSGLGHGGGAAVGAVAGVLLNYQRFGRAWQRFAAVGGLLVVPVVCVAFLVRSMDTNLRWKALIHQAQVEQAREEIRELEQDLLPKANAAERPGLGAYGKEAQPLLQRDPEERDPAAVRRAVAALAEAQGKLAEAADLFRKAGPYRSDIAEEARKVRLENLETRIRLFALTQRCLEQGENWAPAEQKELEQVEDQMDESERHWRKLVK